MIKLDAKSGAVYWGEYELYIRLQHDDFLAKYPDTKVKSIQYLMNGTIFTSYELPFELINGQRVILKLWYCNQFIDGIGITQETHPLEAGANEDEWWRWQLRWIDNAHSLLKNNFGHPHQITKSALLYEENISPAEYIDQLENWHYGFNWGRVSSLNESQTLSYGIDIRYETLQQIRNWDELIESLHQKIINEQKWGKDVEGLKLMLPIIQNVKTRINYELYRPSIGCRHLGLEIPNSKTRVWVTVIGNGDKFQIQCSDSIQSHIVDDTELVEKILQIIDDR